MLRMQVGGEDAVGRDCANGSVQTWLRIYGERHKEGPWRKKKKTKEGGDAQPADLFEPEQRGPALKPHG